MALSLFKVFDLLPRYSVVNIRRKKMLSASLLQFPHKKLKITKLFPVTPACPNPVLVAKILNKPSRKHVTDPGIISYLLLDFVSAKHLNHWRTVFWIMQKVLNCIYCLTFCRYCTLWQARCSLFFLSCLAERYFNDCVDSPVYCVRWPWETSDFLVATIHCWYA